MLIDRLVDMTNPIIAFVFLTISISIFINDIYTPATKRITAETYSILFFTSSVLICILYTVISLGYLQFVRENSQYMVRPIFILVAASFYYATSRIANLKNEVEALAKNGEKHHDLKEFNKKVESAIKD